MEVNLRKLIQIVNYYLIPAGLLIYIIKYQNGDFRLYRDMVSLGNLAIWLVSILIFVKPLHIILNRYFKFNKLMYLIGYRREFGVLAFWITMFHGIYIMYYYKLFSLANFSLLNNEIYSKIVSGIIAGVGIFIMGITSNKLSAIKFGRNWKKIQKIAYPTYVLVVVHLTFTSYGSSALLLLISFIILKGLEYLIVKENLVN